MIAEHYAAVRALIPSTLKVYPGVVPDDPVYPYAVVWGTPGTHDTESLSDVPSTLTLRPYVTVAGLSFDQVCYALDITRPALNRARPVITGRVSHRMVQSQELPIQPDLTVTVTGVGHPFYAVDAYTLITDPA